jgi:8-oxo-dGTP pyrophosphatase MutT (NUDIX family)
VATEAGAEAWGCKKLDPGQLASGIGGIGLSWCGEHDVQRSDQSTRRPMLTSFISVITSDAALVLCQRSSKTSNGASVLSATAGGVSELGQVGGRSDRDDDGWPDLSRSALRELREELGLELESSAVRPACIFLANSVNRASGLGQLVVCTLYLARTELTFDELAHRQQWASDLAIGMFEVESLERLDLHSDEAKFLADVKAVAPRLDQHGALSIAYAARHYRDQDDAVRVLSAAFESIEISLLAEPHLLSPDRVPWPRR